MRIEITYPNLLAFVAYAATPRHISFAGSKEIWKRKEPVAQSGEHKRNRDKASFVNTAIGVFITHTIADSRQQLTS